MPVINVVNKIFKRQIRHYIRKEISRFNTSQLLPEFQLVTNSSIPKIIRILWVFVLILCSIICCYQTYERIEFYGSEPTFVNVAVSERETTDFREMILANLYNEAYLPFWPVGSDNKTIDNVLYCSSPLPMLLRHSESAIQNLTNLWLASNSTVHIKNLSIEYNGKLVSWVVFNNNTVERSNNEKYFNWTEKIALQGLLSVVTIVNPVKIGSKLNLVLKKSGLCSFQLAVLFLKDELVPFRYSLKGRFGITIDVKLSTKQYNFVNTHKRRCEVNNEKITQCYYRCLNKRYNTVNCSFPFMQTSANLKDCSLVLNGSNMINKYLEVKQMLLETSPTFTCGCPRPCKHLFSRVDLQKYHIDDKTIMHFQFHLNDPYTTIFDEVPTYDTIKLIIDIGGNIGLLLGLSLLSIIEYNQFGIFYLQNKLTKKLNRNNKTENYLLSKCRAILTSVKKTTDAKSILTASNNSPSLWKIIVAVLCAVLTIDMIYEKVLYYLQDPFRISVTLTEERKIYVPNLVLCGESAKVFMWRTAMEKQTGIPPCKLHFLDLIDLLIRKVSLDDLWAARTVGLDDITLAGFERVNSGLKFRVNRSETIMHSGTCIEYLLWPYQYVGEATGYQFSLDAIGNRDCYDGLLQLYLRPHNAKIYSILLSQRNVLANFIGFVAFRMFTVRKLNTNNRPCFEVTGDFEACKSNCIEEKIQKLIKCRLPFMNDVKYSSCNNATTAKESYSTFMKIAIQTDILKECRCFPACENIVYQPFLYYDEPDIPSTTQYAFPLSNFMENFNEESAYNFVGLICDTGNTIGITVGLSVLSMMYLTSGNVAKLVAALKLKCTKL